MKLLQKILESRKHRIETALLKDLEKYAYESGIIYVEYGQNRANPERRYSMVFEDLIIDFTSIRKRKGV